MCIIYEAELFGLLLKKAKPDIYVLVFEYVGLVFCYNALISKG